MASDTSLWSRFATLFRRHPPRAKFDAAAWRPLPNGEIIPPWVAMPGFGFPDFFWSEAGEPWFYYIWKPFYDALTPAQQADYLERWKPPPTWTETYFSEEWNDWLDHIDDEEPTP